MRVPSRSLFVTLLAPIAGAVALLTLAVVVQGSRWMQGAVLERAEARAEALVEAERDEIVILARYGAHHLELQRIIEVIGRHPDLSTARLLRPNGVVRASSQVVEVGQLMPQLVPAPDAGETVQGDASAYEDGIVHAVRPLLNGPDCVTCHQQDGPVLGWLNVDVLVSEHRTGVRAFGQLSSVLGLLYFLAAVGLAVPTLGFLVVRPLRRLMAALERVEAGDLTATVPTTGTTEIDAVVEGFNGMVARLRQGRAAEQEAQRLQMERVEQLASVGHLATGLAHEFRNPLSSVRAVLEVVAEEPGRRESRQVLREAAGELDRLDQIVRDLLRYARPRAPSLASFDLDALVREVAQFTISRGTSSGAVHMEPATHLPPVIADADMTRQVLVNLLLNAQQAAPAGGAKITIATGHNGQRAWCRVRDNGPGVPADRAATLFRPFVTTKTRGTGLGLSISRRIVELLGGQLTLDNPGEPGASFTFTLPLATRAAEPRTNALAQDTHR
jgi:signal transduction histidine kinase